MGSPSNTNPFGSSSISLYDNIGLTVAPGSITWPKNSQGVYMVVHAVLGLSTANVQGPSFITLTNMSQYYSPYIGVATNISSMPCTTTQYVYTAFFTVDSDSSTGVYGVSTYTFPAGASTGDLYVVRIMQD